MPTYIMLSTLTPEGVQTVKNNPQRIREVNKEIEQLGATVKAQWATLGQFDFVNVVEAPDERTMARVSLELGSRGTVALRDARRDPDRRLHRVALGAGPRRRRRRARARDRPRAAALAAGARGARARPATPGSRADAATLRRRRRRRRRAGGRVARRGRRPRRRRPRGAARRGPRRRARRRRGIAVVRPDRARPRGSRARRRSPRRSWPPPACRRPRGRRSTTSTPAWRRSSATRSCSSSTGSPPARASSSPRTRREARGALHDFLVERRFGAGRVVVEEHLDGEELSLLALCDGERAVADGARRRTTSGSSTATRARTPAAWAPTRRSPGSTPRSSSEIARTVHQPVVDELRHRGTPFHGVLYAGLMLTADGPAGARVQRPLRRPRDPGRAAAAALATCSTCCSARRRPAGLRGAELEWDERWAVTRRARQRRLPGVVVVRRRDHGLDAVPGRASRSRTRAPARRRAARSSPPAGACST